MGIRGCDIVRLKLTDISFKNKTVRFVQDKTNVEVQLAMPVSVGNAIFRYLKHGRPQGIVSDLLFVSLKAPYRSLTRNICIGALKRILPQRNILGSGFHVFYSTSKMIIKYRIQFLVQFKQNINFIYIFIRLHWNKSS